MREWAVEGMGAKTGGIKGLVDHLDQEQVQVKDSRGSILGRDSNNIIAVRRLFYTDEELKYTWNAFVNIEF